MNIEASYTLTEQEQETLPNLHRHVWKRKFRKVLTYFSNELKERKVNAVDYWDRTPLHYAAALGYSDIVKFLLTIKGIKVDKRDSDGNCDFYYYYHYTH